MTMVRARPKPPRIIMPKIIKGMLLKKAIKIKARLQIKEENAKNLSLEPNQPPRGRAGGVWKET